MDDNVMWRMMSSTEIMQTTKDLLSSSSDGEMKDTRRRGSVVGKQSYNEREGELPEKFKHRQHIAIYPSLNEKHFSVDSE